MGSERPEQFHAACLRILVIEGSAPGLWQKSLSTYSFEGHAESLEQSLAQLRSKAQVSFEKSGKMPATWQIDQPAQGGFPVAKSDIKQSMQECFQGERLI